MALAPVEKLNDLARIFRESAPPPSKFESFSETWAKIKKYSKMLGMAAAQSGIQSGVTIGAAVPVASVSIGIGSIALFPLGAALAPWFGALAIGLKANAIFALHDLRASARSGGVGSYPCTCGNCVANLTYVIDRKEANVAIMAVGVFTAGLAIIADRLNSVRKSFQSNRPKEKICVSMIVGARNGCICAIGGIMMICGEWKNEANNDSELSSEAIAIIWSKDGHARPKSKW